MSSSRAPSLDDMTKIYTGASMSLDGYISGPEESGFELPLRVVRQRRRGRRDRDVGPDDEHDRRMSAAYFRQLIETRGRARRRPQAVRLHERLGAAGTRSTSPSSSLTHNPPTDWKPRQADSFVFVTEGIEAAIAQAARARGRQGRRPQRRQMASQALQAGLIDEVWIDLVPVLLGGGTPFFAQFRRPGLARGPAVDRRGQGASHTCAIACSVNVCSPIAPAAPARARRRAGRRAVDDDPQVAAGDGQHVAVDRDPPDLRVVDRLAVGDVAGDGPLLPELGEARAGAPAGRRSARAAARRPGSGRRRRAGRRRPASICATSSGVRTTREGSPAKWRRRTFSLVLAEQRGRERVHGDRSARRRRRPSPARR